MIVILHISAYFCMYLHPMICRAYFCRYYVIFFAHFANMTAYNLHGYTYLFTYSALFHPMFFVIAYGQWTVTDLHVYVHICTSYLSRSPLNDMIT